MPEPEANIWFEPFALFVHTGGFVGAFWVPALLDCGDEFLKRLLRAFLAGKAIPDLLIEEDPRQMSLAGMKLRPLTGESSS